MAARAGIGEALSGLVYALGLAGGMWLAGQLRDPTSELRLRGAELAETVHDHLLRERGTT
jgi:hypothetical protein